jgi:hypothetical protein
MKWYVVSWSRDTTKKSNPLNEISRIKKKEVKKIYLNEEQESRERSNLMVELCEQPYYSTTNTKHEPE